MFSKYQQGVGFIGPKYYPTSEPTIVSNSCIICLYYLARPKWYVSDAELKLQSIGAIVLNTRILFIWPKVRVTRWSFLKMVFQSRLIQCSTQLLQHKGNGYTYMRNNSLNEKKAHSAPCISYKLTSCDMMHENRRTWRFSYDRFTHNTLKNSFDRSYGYRRLLSSIRHRQDVH